MNIQITATGGTTKLTDLDELPVKQVRFPNSVFMIYAEKDATDPGLDRVVMQMDDYREEFLFKDVTLPVVADSDALVDTINGFK